MRASRSTRLSPPPGPARRFPMSLRRLRSAVLFVRASWGKKVVAALVVSGLAALAAPAFASAAAPRAVVRYPSIVVAGRALTVSGTWSGRPGAHAALQQRSRGRWVMRATARTTGHRFAVSWRVPKGLTTVTLRVAVSEGRRTVKVTAAHRITFSGRARARSGAPVDVPTASTVTSVPPPGQPGALHLAGAASVRPGDV